MPVQERLCVLLTIIPLNQVKVIINQITNELHKIMTDVIKAIALKNFECDGYLVLYNDIIYITGQYNFGKRKFFNSDRKLIAFSSDIPDSYFLILQETKKE